jgi:hypothetical protein
MIKVNDAQIKDAFSQKYQLLERLGDGNFAVVHVSYWQDLLMRATLTLMLTLNLIPTLTLILTLPFTLTLTLTLTLTQSPFPT